MPMNAKLQVRTKPGLELHPLEHFELNIVSGGFRPVATPAWIHSIASDGAIGYLIFRLGWGQKL